MRKHRRKVDWIDADVRCPFYYEGSGNEIQCESYKDGMTLVLTFRNRQEKNGFMGVSCCGDFFGCPYYVINENSYEKKGLR